jgi:hypothetical protein
LLLTQEDVLWVPEASGDLLSLGKLTRFSFKALLYAGKQDLIYADPERLGEVALSITEVNDVYPISLTAAKRADAETKQVQETLRLHRKFISKAFSAFPRVVTVKHIGEENLPEGEGEAYLSHVRFGHRIGAPGRVGRVDITSGTCPSCMLTGMADLKMRGIALRSIFYSTSS